MDCGFMPMALFTNKRLMPLLPKIKGATLGWYVNRKFVSYKQIKSVIITNSLRINTLVCFHVTTFFL